MKVSSYLFLKTDPNELLLMTDVPNLDRPWRAMSAVIDTDWYPASYPWHCVLELSPDEKRIKIKKGEPICAGHPDPARHAISPSRCRPMRSNDSSIEARSGWRRTGDSSTKERWTSPHTYVRQQARSRFIVMT